LVELDPAAFASAASGPDAVVVNVHIPYEGEIAATDAFIPFDQVLEHPDLPTDRTTRLVLYCRSGRMSEDAGDQLLDAGYTDVSHLAGGMDAWEDDGRELVTDPAR
jgi:phage shock protein E